MNTTNSNAPTLVGRVVSDKRDKTITILIERKIQHHLIGKQLYARIKFMHMMRIMSIK